MNQLLPPPVLRSRLLALWALLALGAVPTACSDDSSATADAGPDALADATPDGDTGTDALGDTNADGDPDAEPPSCDTSRRPIVFVHGFLASGDTFANHAARFASNGYCLDWIRAFDWNSLDQRADHETALDAFITGVLADTGAAQLDLAGHSAGGGLGYRYLADADHAARVAHYAHIASSHQDGPAGPEGAVPTLNLWSEDDTVIDDKGDIEGATNVMLTGDDHYAVATSEASFAAIYAFFNDGEDPDTVTIVPETPIVLSGRVVSLGENTPAAGGTVAAWPVDAATGLREGSEPVAQYALGDDGAWGPLDVEPETTYELVARAAGEGDRPVHYYFEPFERSSQLVYLRVLPSPGTLAGVLLSAIPFDDQAAVLVNFTASTGIVAGRDSLTVDSAELATEALASADQTTIALFLYDANENQATDGTPIAAFSGFPFLNGVDTYFDATVETTIEVVFNGRTLHARAWPSDTEGATITVFR